MNTQTFNALMNQQVSQFTLRQRELSFDVADLPKRKCAMLGVPLWASMA